MKIYTLLLDWNEKEIIASYHNINMRKCTQQSFGQTCVPAPPVSTPNLATQTV